MDSTIRNQLIKQYKDLESLRDINPQRRGQLFNGFIARIIDAYGHKAKANNYGGPGEIDVAFTINGTRYILEAKWEKKRIDEEPISKIRTRVNQRLAGTVGIVLSMSGFTKKALKNMRLGQRLEVLLLTKEHFEALLYGFLNPVDLFENILNNAHFNGEPLTLIKNLAQASIHLDKFDWSKDFSINFEIREGFEVEKILEGGIEISKYLHYAPHEGLLTKAEEFIVKVNTAKQKLIEVNGIPEIYDYAPINDGCFYALRKLQDGYTLAEYFDSDWDFIPITTKTFSEILLHSSGEVFALTKIIFRDDYKPINPCGLMNMDKKTTVELKGDFYDMCCTANGTFVGLNYIDGGNRKNIVEFTKEGKVLKNIEVDSSSTTFSMAGEREVYVISNNLSQITLMNLDTSETKIVLTSESRIIRITQKSNTEAYFSGYNKLENNVTKGVIFKLKRNV